MKIYQSQQTTKHIISSIVPTDTFADAHEQNNLDDYGKFLEVPSHTEAAIHLL